MGQELALIAEGGGMRGSYVYGAMKALDEVFNDQQGLMNFSHMAGTSASALTLLYAIAEQFHIDGFEIWSNKVTRKRFLNDKALHRLVFGPPILDVFNLVDEIFAKEHPLVVDRIVESNTRFYIPVVDVASLELKYFTNDYELGQGMMPYDFIYFDKDNPHELYSVMKAAAAAPIAFNHQIEIQGRHYIDGGLLASFPINAPIPVGVKRIFILTQPSARKAQWLRDKLLPSLAKGGFLHGDISNSNLFPMISQESANYKLMLEELEKTENCLVIKPDLQLSSSNNSPRVMKRNIQLGFSDVIANKEKIQNFLLE